MTAREFVPTKVHLVGAVGLYTVTDVFSAVGKTLGTRVKRVPDGEPGGRRLWISWQYPLLRANPNLRPDPEPDRQSATGFKILCAAEGVPDEDIHFGELGYAREARASYLDFVNARASGELPPDVRFQVSLPTPLAVVHPFCSKRDLFAIERAYEAAMLREVAEICRAIPHSDLCIQWDVCIEMVMWDGRFAGYMPPFDDPESEIIDRLVRICQAVPADVELGFHLCYGDWEAKHFIEPLDGEKMTSLANAIAAHVRRPIAYFHMPVPIERDDEDFFRPMEDLKLPAGTELYLGCVHDADGIEGAKRRIDVARRYVPDFGIASECGLGRCKTPEVVSRILQVHADASEAPDDG